MLTGAKVATAAEQAAAVDDPREPAARAPHKLAQHAADRGADLPRQPLQVPSVRVAGKK